MGRHGDNQANRFERREKRREASDYIGSFEGVAHQVNSAGHATSKVTSTDDEGLEMTTAQHVKDADCSKDGTGDEANKKKKQPSVPYHKLYSFSDPFDWLLMSLGTVGACAHGSAIPVFFIFFGKLIDAFGANYARPDLMAAQVRKYSLYFVVLGAVVLFAAWAEVACWMWTGERQSAKMRTKYLKAMLDQEVGFFDTEVTTGEIVSRISSDCILVQEAISEKAGQYIHYMARFVAGFAVGFSSVWQLTLVTLAVVPLIAIAGGAYAVTMIGLTSKSQKAYAKAGEIAEQAIAQIRTVYAFVGEEKTTKSYSESLSTTFKLGQKGGMAKGLGVGFTYGLLFGAWALLLWFASILVMGGKTNGGQAFTTILNVIISGIALGQAAPNITTFGKGKAAGYNILEMIKRKPTVNANLLDGRTLPHVEGHIELRNVTFSYPSRRQQMIFQNFNLTIPAGTTVAIVGGSGSGKSTVIALIERFYDPNSGQILLDGADIQSLQLKWFRERLGLVNQEPALFAASILENIMYGKEGATMQEVEEAAKAANAHSFISLLPNGYHTQVGERGVQMSGGQKQRIAIARAMLKRPSILLLDEATSALDAASEGVVQEALDGLMIGRTTVIVAHRLSTIRNADKIAVVREGKIIETGTHDELLAKNGPFSLLVKMQERAKLHSLRSATLSRTNSRLSSYADGGPISTSSRYSSGRFSNRWSHRWSLSRKAYRNGIDFESDVVAGIEPEEQKPHSDPPLPKPSLWRLFKLNSPEWPQAVLGTIGAAMAGAETPLFALAITQVLITFYNPDHDFVRSEVRKICIIFSAGTVVTLLIYILQHYYYGIMGERLTMRVREMMFKRILTFEIGWFDYDDNNSSLVASRLSADATLVRAAVGDRLSTVTQNLALITTAFVIAFILCWRIALVILATFPCLIGAAIAEQFFLKGFGGDLNKAYSRASMIAGEAVGNIRTVAAFCAEGKVLELFQYSLAQPAKNSVIRGHIAGFGYGISQFTMFSSYGLAFWYASVLVQNREAQFGDIIKTFMVMVITAFGIAETLALAPDIVKGSEAVVSVFEILDRKSKIDPDDPSADEVVHITGDIEFRRVSFSYPSRADVQIFEDFGLKVRSGQSLALVGASGSGKSSIISLIARFYDPTAGAVLIDGVDIKKLRLRSLRRHIGLVQQEPALFSSTIYTNILYGNESATESEVMEAAKAANAHTFISGLPQGYQTDVGERGVQLSGGQKQRVAIARAVLKNPAILLLDEATSALDAHSEKIVQDALDRLMRGRTTVMIAHRLSTIKNADVIAVVDGGRIVELGNHDNLMSKSGSVYAQLVHLQQSTDSES
ncbi:hypothetical protein R1sor_012991 [Riccia sorocarpa]|uniref:Uncharacterized protein n=1 Tax=Riccia sorocarpa TaxID=122646 RepID=A0ABD3I952_9MARC